MRITIANLRAAGMSAEQIVKVLEEADAERREKARIIKRNQRARPPCPPDSVDNALSLSTLNLKGTKERKSSVHRTVGTKRTTLPDDWQPQGPQRDPIEPDEFRDHARAKGYQYADWHAAYRNFQKSAFNPRNGKGQPTSKVLPTSAEQKEIDKYVAQLEEAKRRSPRGANRQATGNPEIRNDTGVGSDWPHNVQKLRPQS
jgi:hypothetical protein